MLLLITFLPLVNFLLFPLFARFVATQVLARYVYVSMGALLGGLIALLPAIAQGEVY